MATNTVQARTANATLVTLDSLIDDVERDGKTQYRAAQRAGDEDRHAEAMYLAAGLARRLVADARQSGATDADAVALLMASESAVVRIIGEEVAWALYQQGQRTWGN